MKPGVVAGGGGGEEKYYLLTLQGYCNVKNENRLVHVTNVLNTKSAIQMLYDRIIINIIPCLTLMASAYLSQRLLAAHCFLLSCMLYSQVGVCVAWIANLHAWLPRRHHSGTLPSFPCSVGWWTQRQRALHTERSGTCLLAPPRVCSLIDLLAK